MTPLRRAIQRAIRLLPCRTAVGRDYAAAVLRGDRTWSGADLHGRAKRYGTSYAARRRDALRALNAAGGCVVAVDHGRLVSAVVACTDDYGDVVYSTLAGYASPRQRASMRLRVWGAP